MYIQGPDNLMGKVQCSKHHAGEMPTWKIRGRRAKGSASEFRVWAGSMSYSLNS